MLGTPVPVMSGVTRGHHSGTQGRVQRRRWGGGPWGHPGSPGGAPGDARCRYRRMLHHEDAGTGPVLPGVIQGHAGLIPAPCHGGTGPCVPWGYPGSPRGCSAPGSAGCCTGGVVTPVLGIDRGHSASPRGCPLPVPVGCCTGGVVAQIPGVPWCCQGSPGVTLGCSWACAGPVPAGYRCPRCCLGSPSITPGVPRARYHRVPRCRGGGTGSGAA